MSWAAQLVAALAIFAGGVAGGIKWHAGQDAIAARRADEIAASDARQQRTLNDAASGRQAARLAQISTQLGDARVQLQSLTGRECLDAGTVSVLNHIGADPVRAAAGQPETAPSAAATDRDVGQHIALCRARYAEVSSQLDQILDIEEARHPVRSAAP